MASVGAGALGGLTTAGASLAGAIAARNRGMQMVRETNNLNEVAR